MGALPWSQLGPAGLLAIAVAMILSGWLVPRRSLRDAQKERDKWEALALKSQETFGELVPQMREAVESGRTTEMLLRGIVDKAERAKEPG